MKRKNWLFGAVALAMVAAFGGCADDDSNNKAKVSSSGTFDTPVGAGAAGPATAGNAYEFVFSAEDGDALAFATMFVFSNDLFYGPGADGIDLFDANGNPVTGDVTAQIGLWDAGTEVNQTPDGSGSDQPPNQAAPNTGTDENGVVQPVSASGDGFTYPAVTDNIQVVLAHDGTNFTLTINNLGTSSTPLAPGVWAVFTGNDLLFTNGEADRGEGLESLAEDGDPSTLAANL